MITISKLELKLTQEKEQEQKSCKSDAWLV